MRKIIAIIGDAQIEPDGPKYMLAYETAKALIDNGYRVQSGGLFGVMEAAFKGAHASKNYREGDTVAILPGFDISAANTYADIAIPTGLDIYRNVIVANAAAVIAVGGGGGTLSEISNAWAMKRLIIAFKNAEGWSSKVADTKLDARIRYPEIPDDRIYGAESAEDVIRLLDEKLKKYNDCHKGIKK